jgi:hypothetical protein
MSDEEQRKCLQDALTSATTKPEVRREVLNPDTVKAAVAREGKATFDEDIVVRVYENRQEARKVIALYLPGESEAVDTDKQWLCTYVKYSSARFKDEIKPMDKASEAILALNPVTFYYKQELDPDGIPQFGLVAEEVEKVNPDLVVRDTKGKAYGVRYGAVGAMLLNEFLKEHRIVQEQATTIAQLRKRMEGVVTSLKEQESKLQRISAELAVN